jgi:tetratricopeptide (TPR) repeat protein
VQCGTNLLTGQKIAQERAQSPVRRGIDYKRWPIFVGIAVVLIVILVLIWLLPQLLVGPVAKARALAQENKELEALNVLSQHLLSTPDDAEGQLLFGKLRMKRGDYNDAAGAFLETARVKLEDTNALWLAAMAVSKQRGGGNLAEIEGIFEQITERNPEDGEAWLALAMARGRQNDLSGQIQALQRAQTLLPGNATAPRQLGIALIRQGRLDEGAEMLRAVEGQGSEPGPAALAALGVVASMKDNDEEATEFFEAAGGAMGGKTATRLGLARLKRGQFDEAALLLQASGDVRPDSAELAFYHALALQATGRTDDAANIYAQVAELSAPQSLEAGVELVKLHVLRGDVSRARDRLEQAKTLWKNDEAKRTERERQRIQAMLETAEGQVAMAEDRTAEALRAFQRASEADPEYPPAALERGLYYIQTGAMADGLRELKQYISLMGDSSDGRVNEIAVLVRQLEESAQG